MGVTFGRQPCLDPAQEIQNCRAHGRPVPRELLAANSFTTTIGPTPGVGHVVMLKRDLDKLDRDATHSLEFDDPSLTLTFPNLVFLEAKCHLPGAETDPMAAFCVTLADLRYLCHNRHYCHVLSGWYNIRVPVGPETYYTSSMNGGVPWTWQTMLDNIWAIFGANVGLGSSPALPFTPDGLPEGFNFAGISAWQAYNDILTRLGCAFKLNPLTATGAASIVQIGVSDASFTTFTNAKKDRLVHSDYSIDGGRSKVPATVKVLFRCQLAESGGEQLASIAGRNLAGVHFVTVNNPSPPATVTTGSAAILHDELPLFIKPDGTYTNESAVNARASERGADYFRAISTSRSSFERIYTGLHNDSGMLPGSQVVGASWYNHGSGWATSIIRIHPGWGMGQDPFWSLSEVVADNPGSGWGWWWHRFHEGYASHRPGYTWAQDFSEMQIVLVHSGGPYSPSGAYPGRVYRVDWTTGTTAAAELCYIKKVSLTDTTLTKGEYYIAKRVGTFTVDGETRGLYIAAGSPIDVQDDQGNVIVWGARKIKFKTRTFSVENPAPGEAVIGNNGLSIQLPCLIGASCNEQTGELNFTYAVLQFVDGVLRVLF